MDYAVFFFDGTSKVIPGSAYPAAAEAMASKATLDLGGSMVSGASISRIGPVSSSRYGPENTSQIGDGSQLALGDGRSGFWKRVLELNEARRGKSRWYLPSAVEWGRAESGMESPEDIFAFLDSEPELTAEANASAAAEWVREKSREYFATDPGRGYLRYAISRGLAK